MKMFLPVGIVVFALLALGSFLVSLAAAGQFYVEAEREAPRNYHFALYLPDNRNSFFTGIIAGAEQAAGELNASVSVHSIDPVKHELEMASYTGVDGVVVCPYLEDALARRQLEKLSSRQIPLVTINHNVPNEQPWPFIGINHFEVGKRIGALSMNLNGPLRMALVYSDKSPGIYGERELAEMGITTALGDRLAAPILGFRTNLNPLDAEELLYRLFRIHPDINTVVFTDSNDTTAAAQTLIDMNLVGRVQVIGFGEDVQIRDSIRKGILAGSIVINGERIGYEAIRSLAALRTTGYTSTSIDTGIKVLSRSGLP